MIAGEEISAGKSVRIRHLMKPSKSLLEKHSLTTGLTKTHSLDIRRSDLFGPMRLATKDQLFQFDRTLYEQDDVVAMGLPVGPLMGNAYLCSAEEIMERENKMPEFYRKYANDTLATFPNTVTLTAFLLTLNGCQSSVQFSMEIASNNKLPFVGMMIEEKGCHLTTCLSKPTNIGLLSPPALSEPRRLVLQAMSTNDSVELGVSPFIIVGFILI